MLRDTLFILGLTVPVPLLLWVAYLSDKAATDRHVRWLKERTGIDLSER